MNYDENLDYNDRRPIWDNDQNPIPPDNTLPIYTEIVAWFDSNQEPNESQNDFQIAIDHNNYREYYYTAEIVRALNTSHNDDIAINLTKPLKFLFGEDSYSFDLLYGYNEYDVYFTNELAELSFDAIEDANPEEDGIQISNSFVITGMIYDDFRYYQLRVTNSLWGDVYRSISVNQITGEWQYLLLFNKNTLPLGESVITVTLYPAFEDPISMNQTIFVEDNDPPLIQGVVDIAERYPEGVPADERSVEISIGIIDNYDSADDITPYLYYYKEGDVTLSVEMQPITSSSRLFITSIPIFHGMENTYEYSYFIEVFDASMNKVTTEKYNFTSLQRLMDEGGPRRTLLIPYLPLSSVIFILFIFSLRRKWRK